MSGVHFFRYTQLDHSHYEIKCVTHVLISSGATVSNLAMISVHMLTEFQSHKIDNELFYKYTLYNEMIHPT